MARLAAYLPEHGAYLAERIHPANAAEAMALSGLAPLEAIAASVERSNAAWTGFDREGNPLAVFGIRGDLLGGVGYPWLVCRKDIADHGLEFARWFRRVLGLFIEQYEELVSLVDDRNDPVKAMLEWAGFELEDARPFGKDGLPFRVVRLRRGDG